MRVETTADGDGPPRATLTSVPTRSRPADPGTEIEPTLAALRWSADDLDPALPPHVAYAGNDHLVLAAATRERLADLDYDYDALEAVMRRRGWTTVHLVWRETPDDYAGGPAKDSGDGLADGSADGSAGGPAQGPGDDPTQGSANDPANGSTDDPANDPAGGFTGGPTEAREEVPSGGPAEGSRDSSTEGPTNNFANDPADDSTGGLANGPADSLAQGFVFHARDPFPVGGVVEDPATGAAAAAFGGYLRVLGLVDGPTRVRIRQGEDMGRPSDLLLDVTPGDPRVRVSGQAVPIPSTV
ncbi:PhzF family phenazine biosynthesis protein [Streptomyces malaysiensis]|uniref:PhzF family phenazine biosynthesis protein n=1 Tax=Streptomyces malaysiensis TaxID=92644 RepID=UPI002B2A79AD|nr:PhzF family phenazine biosynthesis protein [Streptomyces malaysiensis]